VQIDFMLEAWFHRALPGGGASIDITSLIVFLNGSTDAPHFLMELIQGGPSSLFLLLDLFPRRDLPLHPSYVHEYYSATNMDAHRQDVERIPQVRPYVSPSLLVRTLWSPTAVVVDARCGEGGGGADKLEEVVRGQIASSASAVLDVWLQRCAGSVVEMEGAERESLVARDKMIASTSVELNLSANLPKMFSTDVSRRVVAEISKSFVGSENGIRYTRSI
jgi:red chlorophyll catabolite reductase